MISLINITKKLNRKIIFKNVNYKFQNGIYQIKGPNGSGKSVLLKIISKLDNKITGKIIYNNINYKTLFLSDGGIGIPYLSIYDNIKLCAKILSVNINKENIIQLFNNKNSLLKNFYEKSSLGNQNKVGLSLLFSNSHFDLIILDETLNGIDKESKKIIINRLKILKEDNCIILFVSHDIDLSNEISGINIIYMDDIKGD